MSPARSSRLCALPGTQMTIVLIGSSALFVGRVDLKNQRSFWVPDIHTLQGTNISQLGKRTIIFKMPFLGDMLLP